MREAVNTVIAPEAIVALVGSPNSGKTTLFNWLTGSRFKTVNYPGATVDYSLGKTHARYGETVSVMDTPGTYSLDPKSPDERVTSEAIFNHRIHGAATVVVAVADATHLARQMLVTRQLIEAGFPVVLAVTMSDLLTESRETLDTEVLSKELGIPVVLINGRLGGGVDQLVEAIRSQVSKADQNKTAKGAKSPAWSDDKVESTLAVNSAIVAKALLPQVAQRQTSKKLNTARMRTRKIDRILLHPVFGLLIFLFLMGFLFSSIFWAAAPAMDAVDKSFSWLSQTVRAISPDNLFIQLLSNGVLASVGAVMTFVPQIFILFVGIVLLEDSGYLARSATLVDRPLSKLGMGGRSFVPILSGFACAIPAMLASRTINSKRERWLTLFILPLMTCSARLPVYALLLAFLFHGQPAWYAGLALALIYVSSLIIGCIAAMIASRFLKVDDRSFFMMELPVYRRPQASLVFRQAITRTSNYLKRAGMPIFIFSLVVWTGTTFPNYIEKDDAARLQGSYAAQFGHVIEPVFKPMGGDWRTGVGLISAFAAREVFVSSLAVLMQVSTDNEATLKDSLIEKMQAAKAPDGYPLFTLASALGLIIFFALALQCLSTVAVSAKESGGWSFALMQLVVFNVVGYVVAVSVVQGLRAMGIA